MPRQKRKPSHDMADRLDAVRKSAGLRLTEFRNRLVEDGNYAVSYQSVQNYHFDRPAPVEYLARVAEVFGADFSYLATGHSRAAPERREVPPALDAFHRMWTEFQAWEESQSRFFWPLSSATAAGSDDLLNFAMRMHERAGRLRFFDLQSEAEMEQRMKHIHRLCELLDDVFATTWEGMGKIVAHQFGVEVADSRTLEQQVRFRDAMLVVLNGLFPDYGDPAPFKNRSLENKETHDG